MSRWIVFKLHISFVQYDSSRTIISFTDSGMNNLPFFTNRSQNGCSEVFNIIPRRSVYVFSPMSSSHRAAELNLQLLSSSEPQAPRTRSAWRWSSQTGLPRLRPHSGWGHTWRKARRRAARRSGLCRRNLSETGRSNLQVWSRRPSLKG